MKKVLLILLFFVSCIQAADPQEAFDIVTDEIWETQNRIFASQGNSSKKVKTAGKTSGTKAFSSAAFREIKGIVKRTSRQKRRGKKGKAIPSALEQLVVTQIEWLAQSHPKAMATIAQACEQEEESSDYKNIYMNVWKDRVENYLTDPLYKVQEGVIQDVQAFEKALEMGEQNAATELGKRERRLRLQKK